MYCWLSVSIKHGASTLLTGNLLGRSIANWMFAGQLLVVVNCWQDENVSYTSCGFKERNQFVDPVHNLLYIFIKLICDRISENQPLCHI